MNNKSYIFEYQHLNAMAKPAMFIVNESSIGFWMKNSRQMAEEFGSAPYTATLYDAMGHRIWWLDYDPIKHMYKQCLNRKWEVYDRMQQCMTPEGEIWYTVWSRDCDMAQGTSGPYLMDANVYAWEAKVNQDHEWAEGPMHHSILTVAEAEEFRRQPDDHRDLAMEAFEDGHPHVVSEVRFETN